MGTRIGARVGDVEGYEVVRGRRVECADGEALRGLPILCWDCDYATVRAFAARMGLDVDFRGAWDSTLPSLDGCYEAMVMVDDIDAIDAIDDLVDRINDAAAAAGHVPVEPQ